MKNQLSFGTFHVPYLNNGESSSVNYIAPSILSTEMLNLISFGDKSTLGATQLIENVETENEEVTHETFFGENVKRLKSLFK